MKSNITKKLIINFETTLDSSEIVMLNQGGMHKTTIPMSDIISESMLEEIDIDNIDILLTVQIDKENRVRHSWITKEAAKAID